MKSIIYSVVSFTLVLLMVSCGGNGPKGRVYTDSRSTDELLHDVLDAAAGDGWVYAYDVDLHKKVNGTWVNVGCYEVYRNLSDDDECTLWVQFGDPIYRMPVELTSKAGYRYRVQFRGEYYYF